jgi:hypothetical protein
MMRLRHVVFGGVAAIVLAGRAEAQQPYALHEMNFDMWCQEEQNLPPDRCDKRLPEDDAAFQAYRAKIEKYEIPYLQKKQRDENLSTAIIHNDHADDPTEPSTEPSAGASTPCTGVITCTVVPPRDSGSPAGGTSTPQQ